MAEYNRNTQSWCCGCEKPKAKTTFLTSLNPNHNKYLPFCRTCINNKLKKYIEKTGSDEAGLYCLCAELGYPFIREYYNIVMGMVTNTPELLKGSNLFTLYHNTLRDLGVVVEGFWQSDVNLGELIDIGVKEEIEETVEEKDYSEQENVWGKFDPEDYELLDDFFDLYTKDIGDMSPAMELRYRDLCKAELRKRKADEGGDRGEIKDAEASIKNMMSMLKLDSFEVDKKSDTDRFIDKLIWTIENTEPCEEEDRETYRDIAGYEEMYNEVMRCMQNMICGTRDYPDVPEGEK